MAEVITRSLAERTELSDGTDLGSHLDVRSAGTGPWHEGEPMHPLAADALVRAGYPRHPHVAHQFSKADIGRLDFLVGLDRRHQQTLRGLGVDPGRLALLRSFDPASGVGADVPDPYYGDDAVFDQCLRHDRGRLAPAWWLAGRPLGHARRGLSPRAPRPAPRPPARSPSPVPRAAAPGGHRTSCDIVPPWSHGGSAGGGSSSPSAGPCSSSS